MAFQDISRTLDTTKPECIYFAIGSALPYVNEIDRDHHQQYPTFLDKFLNKKLIILIDPYMEFPLKLQDYVKFDDSNIEFNDEYTKMSNNEMTVYSVATEFYLSDNNNVSFLQQLLEYVKNNKKYLIIESFSGVDNRISFYNIVMQMPECQEILKYAKCDMMDVDHGCCSNFEGFVNPIDENNHFIHPLLMQLNQIKIRYPEKYKKTLKFKYDNLYDIYRYYKSLKDNTNDNVNINKIKSLLTIYLRKYVEYVNIYVLETALLMFAHELLVVTDNNLNQIEQFNIDLQENTHDFMKNIYLIHKTINII